MPPVNTNLDTHDRPLRALAVAVQLPGTSDTELEISVGELRELAKTLGFEVIGTLVQKRAGFDPTGYLGVGKRQTLRRIVEHGLEAVDLLDEHAQPEASTRAEARSAPADPATRHVDVILVDHDISPSQARNLEIDAGVEVMDRTMVILEIFHRHARSNAARAQVEIARLHYLGPRLREAAKLAGPKARQRSGTGGRGAGETQMALDRQKIRDRIAELQADIERMEADRRTQRARRQSGAGLARVALVGYTNAGKSTLMRALTGSEVLVANKLFATLDTTVRTLHPPTVPRVLVSDTVGFIKNLPHDLVASFKSTLEEALEASLLLHVIDASDPGWERQLKVTDAVLAEIGARDVPLIRVFNKIDGVGDAAAQAMRTDLLRLLYPGCVVMSARRPEDVARLHATIREFFGRDLIETEFFLPWSDQRLRGEVFERCEVIEEHADELGARLRVRAEAATIESLTRQLSGPSREA